MSCPGDCCRLISTSAPVETMIDLLNAELLTVPEADRHWALDLARTISLLEPIAGAEDWNGSECRAYDRATRRCTEYSERPWMCSGFPNYYDSHRTGWGDKACENCTYDARDPATPGVRYAAIEDTGIFAHDTQPEMKTRLERMQ